MSGPVERTVIAEFSFRRILMGVIPGLLFLGAAGGLFAWAFAEPGGSYTTGDIALRAVIAGAAGLAFLILTWNIVTAPFKAGGAAIRLEDGLLVCFGAWNFRRVPVQEIASVEVAPGNLFRRVEVRVQLRSGDVIRAPAHLMRERPSEIRDALVAATSAYSG